MPHPLRSLRVSTIDIEDARQHFDLPIEEQFASASDLRAGLQETKRELLRLLGDQATLTVHRGMVLSPDQVDEIAAGAPAGHCWAWDMDGALKGSGLDDLRTSGEEMGVMLVAEIAPEAIDWATTIAVNTFHADEKEIVVADESAIVLKQMLRIENGKVVQEMPMGGSGNSRSLRP